MVGEKNIDSFKYMLQRAVKIFGVFIVGGDNASVHVEWLNALWCVISCSSHCENIVVPSIVRHNARTF